MSLDASLAWLSTKDLWRAEIGRLPRGHEDRLRALVQQHGQKRVSRAIFTTRDTTFRRTAQRWSFFLALFGEAP